MADAPLPVLAYQSPQRPVRGARAALALLLAINLFNYIDRYVLAAVEEKMALDLLPGRSDALAKIGFLATAFMVSYMLLAPLFGFLADRIRRWLLIGVGVCLWSLASGASGLAMAYPMLLLTRCFVGVGEAAYGPAAPTLIADLYPIDMRGRVMAWFYMAIPVGSALGYILGGVVAPTLGWRWAFYLVVPPGILLGILALRMPEPPRGAHDAPPAPPRRATAADYLLLLRTPSYVLDTLGMTAMTFAIGGMSYWVPRYLSERNAASFAAARLIFGIITVITGISATLLGGIVADKLRPRLRGSYFVVSAVGLLAAFPCVVLMLYTPFPWAWILISLGLFFLFFSTGPTNTILANVTHPAIRASAFALNILIIHALGDAISPWVLGAIRDHTGNMNSGFLVLSGMLLLGALLWLWGARYLERDTAAAPARLADRP